MQTVEGGYDGGYDSLPSGSRLAKYLGGARNNGPPVSTMSVNVPSFVPKVLRENGTADPYARPYQSVTDQSAHDFIPQENLGGTTYYYPHGMAGSASSLPPSLLEQAPLASPSEVAISPDTHTLVTTNGCFTYQGPVPHIGKFRPKSAAGNNSYSQFISPDLKMELLNRQLAMKARADPAAHPDLPQAVEHMRELVPLEPLTKGTTASVYKAISLRDGIPYCLRRIHSFRISNSKLLSSVEAWKKLSITHIVQLREMFATRAFGDHSMVFLYDYHPLAETLKSRHFGRMGGLVDAMSGAKISSMHSTGAAGGVPELPLWSYVVQLTAALRSIHANGLAARCVHINKIIVVGKNKVMLAACGLYDIIQPDHQQIQVQQTEDLMALGRTLLALATGNIHAARSDQMGLSMRYVSQHYSQDMKNLLTFLLTSNVRKSIADVMPIIGARFYNHIECLQMRNDVLENEMCRELENGRLFRLLCKLNSIVERPEHNMDPAWSETGDRFLIKLFRDYVFHQVTESGRPWMDMAHIVHCLNKLDAGVAEKVELVSRDGDNIIIVSYADLKRCIDAAFRELSNTQVIPPPRH